VFYVPGVDRSALKSLWTPGTRWSEVTEQGVEGGPVIPDTYDGSPESIQQIRINILKSGEVGTLVAKDFRSSVVFAPLHEIDPETRKPLDYRSFGDKLEQIRAKYQTGDIRIHIIGFAKIVGDLIDGSTRVATFFGIAFLIMLAFLYLSSWCIRSTAVRAVSSMVAVVWQMGLLHTFGYGLNPYSMLVPFLMFALGVSHGIQMGNAISHELLGGADKLEASRRAFHKMFTPGLAALATCFIGFAVLFVIRIGVIQEIAIGASIGVFVVAFTDLMLLPVLMSYTGANTRSIRRLHAEEEGHKHPVWHTLANFTHPKVAVAAVVVAVIGLGAGLYTRRDLQIGDLDKGAPELRPDSRYNRDVEFMNDHYAASSDVFVVMLETPVEGNSNYNAIVAADRLQWRLQQLSAVQSTLSYVDALKLLNAAYNEGNLKWKAIPRSQDALNNIVIKAPPALIGSSGTIAPILVFLNDHKAETLKSVASAVEAFAAENNTKEYRFLLAAGNSGIEAATNMEIEKAERLMTILVYSVVFLVCLVTYRTLKGALCIVAPLFLTSVLCEALMARLGIGVKVATLPVVAVGVGIGVDYGIYIYSKLLEYLRQGKELSRAYYHTLKTTGRAVAFTGVTLAVGVGTWAFSPIKFQADMGLLLAFMFLWNMVGALCLLPALIRLVGVPKKLLEATEPPDAANLETLAPGA
jgi:predicted RND superfamily exporter protein